MTRPSIAVVVPVHKARLDADERISLRHLQAYLGAHDTFAVCPEGLELPVELPAKRFDARWFSDHRAYSQLLMTHRFYEAFSEYEFVLVHQLDCIVLSDALADWSEHGFDYVGAPWVRRGRDRRPYFAGVGNGGLSLRRVETFVRVLDRAAEPGQRIRVAARHAAAVARRGATRLPRLRDATHAVRTAFRYEDKFWSREAPLLLPGFRIPPPEVAVSFAFESEPRFCFEQNGEELPFGCHRWAFYDRGFWEPHLLRAGT